MLQILLIMLFRISLKNPSLCSLLFFYAPHCHYYSIVPIANDIQCTSIVTSYVYVYNNLIQVMLHKLHNYYKVLVGIIYCRSCFDIVLLCIHTQLLSIKKI